MLMTKLKKLALVLPLILSLLIQVPVRAQSVKKEVQGNRTTYVTTAYTAHAANVGSQKLVTDRPTGLYSIANGHLDERHQIRVPKNTVLTIKDRLTNHKGYVVHLAGNQNQLAIVNPAGVTYATKGVKNNPQKVSQLKAAAKQWAKKLNKTEVKAIRYYTDTGYNKINTALRTPGNQATKKTRASIQAINAGIQRFRLTQPTTIYRGISKEGLKKSLADKSLRVGQQYRDPAYSSCTLSQMTALGFSKQHVVLKINLPVGYHGAYIDPISTNVGEKEYLLKSNVKLIVTKIQKAKSNVHTVTTIKQKGKKTQRQVSNVNTNYQLITLNIKN